MAAAGLLGPELVLNFQRLRFGRRLQDVTCCRKQVKISLRSALQRGRGELARYRAELKSTVFTHTRLYYVLS